MQSSVESPKQKSGLVGQFIVSGRFPYAGFFDPLRPDLSPVQCSTGCAGRRVVQVHGASDSPVFLFSQNPSSRTLDRSYLYDIETSQLIVSYDTTGGPADVTFKLGALSSIPVLFAGSESVYSYDCRSGERRFQIKRFEKCTRLADILCGTGCLLDQQLFVLGSQQRLGRIDACRGKLISIQDMCESGESRRLALDEERQILFGSSWNSTVSLWSLTEEKRIEILNLGDWGDGIFYDDNLLLVGLDYGIILAWDIRQTSSYFARLKMPGRFVNDFRQVFEKNHRFVIAGSDGGALARVDTEKWTFETFQQLPGHVMSICIIRSTPDELLDLRDEFMDERLTFLLDDGIEVCWYFVDVRLTSVSFRLFRSLV